MVVLKHGELYLFSSTEEPYEDAFGVFECIDGGYILLRVMFNGRGMSRNCWLPDAYRIAGVRIRFFTVRPVLLPRHPAGKTIR